MPKCSGRKALPKEEAPYFPNRSMALHYAVIIRLTATMVKGFRRHLTGMDVP